MSQVTEHFFTSRAALFSTLANNCQQILEQACHSRQKASFLVSGGSTPAPLYQALSKRPLPWSNINVALVDERWVAIDDNASNHAFIKETLLRDQATNTPFTPMKNPSASAEVGLSQTQSLYAQLPQPWDLTLLGMGNDGHTASIFPNCTGIEQALDANSDQLLSAIVAKPSRVTGDNLQRMTLSLAGLLKSRHIVLLITGDEKLAIYRQALTHTDHRTMPVSAVLQQNQVPVEVFWAP